MLTCEKCGGTRGVMTTLKRQGESVTLCSKCWQEMIRDLPALMRKVLGRRDGAQ